MPKLTEYEKKQSFYKKLANDKFAQKSRNYKELIDSLNDLNTLVSEYYEPYYDVDKKVKYKSLDTEMYDKVLAAYAKVEEKNNIFRKEVSAENADNMTKSRAFIVEELGNILKKDIKSLQAADRGKPGPLHGIVRQARSITFSISSDVKTVGNFMSARIPVKTKDNSLKGFFTPESHFDKEAAFKKFTKEYKDTYKRSYDKVLDSKFINAIQKSDIDKFGRVLRMYMDEVQERFWDVDENVTWEQQVHTASKVMQEIGGRSTKYDDWKKFFSSDTGDELYQFSDFISDAWDAIQKDNVLINAGIQNGTKIANRNVAMYNVAKLIGCSDVIGKAMHMTQQDGDKKIEGVFMENVEGTNRHNVPEDDPFYTYDQKVYDNPKVLKQLADLQVLDFICGNTDRHMGNLMFDFKKNEKNGTYLAGITGIDNDLSFGAIEDANSLTRKLTPLSNIKVIDSKTAKKILSLNDELLETILAPDISEKERNYAKIRLVSMKEAITRNKIRILTTAEWKKTSLSELKRDYKDDYEKDIFTRLNDMIEENKTLKKEDKEFISKIKGIEFSEVEKKQDHSREKDAFDSVKKLVEDMKAADKFYIGSKEFRTMRNSLYKLGEAVNNQEEITDEKRKEIYELSRELSEKTRDYIVKKGITQSTEHGRDRMALARRMEAISESLYGDILSDYEPKETQNVIEEIEDEFSL